jgi:CRP-like cAMP-binding protein
VDQGAFVVKNSARVLLPASNSLMSDSDGNEIGNLILRNLPEGECSLIFSSMEFVRLKLRQVLHDVGDTIRSIYFLNGGMGSVLTVQPDGKSVEVGLIGKEGAIGVSVIFGFKTSGLRVVTQAEGTAYRVSVETLLRVLPRCPDLQQQLQRFALLLGMQSTQVAACNRLHNVHERLARWLLMTQDRVGGKLLPLTQEFLAQMLGTRRASVSVAAGMLHKEGMIAYTRGNVTIVNRRELEETACDCYQIIEQQKKRWQQETG